MQDFRLCRVSSFGIKPHCMRYLMKHNNVSLLSFDSSLLITYENKSSKFNSYACDKTAPAVRNILAGLPQEAGVLHDVACCFRWTSGCFLTAENLFYSSCLPFAPHLSLSTNPGVLVSSWCRTRTIRCTVGIIAYALNRQEVAQTIY